MMYDVPLEGNDQILYHYTSPDGLLGILENGVIRASDVRFSNDSTEFEHGLSLIRTLLSDMLRDDHDKQEAEILEGLADYCDSLSKHLQSAYVFSLSEVADDLSQWRSYTPSTGGYALGVSKSRLIEITDSLELSIGTCIYDVSVQRELMQDSIRNLLRDGKTILESFKNVVSDDSYVKEAASLCLELKFFPGSTLNAQRFINDAVRAQGIDPFVLAKSLIQLKYIQNMVAFAAQFKHVSFKSEKEVRVIHIPSVSIELTVPLESNFQIGYRARNGSIIPYAKLPILSGDRRDVLRMITTGPHMNEDFKLQKRALLQLLKYRGYSECHVFRSTTPYRSS
ncbi:MAG: DUF2971 domain-containing protein [Candidatus Thorarchaeota archaeon]